MAYIRCYNGKFQLKNIKSCLSFHHHESVVFSYAANARRISGPVFSMSTQTPHNMPSNVSSGENFEKNNKKLKRPISPHLSAHRFSNNMMLSFANRVTGVALYGIPVALASAAFIPKPFQHTLMVLEELSHPYLLISVKFLIAMSFSFHLLNGIRHLVWDVGYLWTPKEVDVSGYIILLLAVGIALHLTFLQPSQISKT